MEAAARSVDLLSPASVLESNSRLAASGPARAPGAVPGTVVSFTVKEGYHYGRSDCSSTPCVLLYRYMQRLLIVAAYQGDMNRFYLFPVNGTLVLATVVGRPDQFQRLLPQAEAIVGGAL